MSNISKDEILKLTKNFYVNSFNVDKSFNLNHLTNFTQESNSRSIIFFHITDEAKFWKYIDKVSYGLLVVTKEIAGIEKLKNIVVVTEQSFLDLQRDFCDIFYPITKSIPVVGITGTNGKTTITTLCSQIALQLGKKTFAIGTVGVFDGHQIIEPLNQTTPNYIDLRKLINKYENQADALFLEVSSHGLKQSRLYDLKLAEVAWSNLTQDHLDYHESMEDYFVSKCLIRNYCNRPIIVAREQQKLQKMLAEKEIKFVQPKSLDERSIQTANKFLKAQFNQSNLEISLQLCENIWGSVDSINVDKIVAPKGRFSLIEIAKNKFVVIDYAHTPDALKNILCAIKDGFKDYKVKVLFGCGGDRDKSKRKLMGEMAREYADYSYLTSDNPRTEEPNLIIDDIKPAYLSTDDYYSNSDRKETILKALEELYDNEILVIAGKGHEEYQDIAGEKIHFSDFEIVKEFIND